MNTKVPHVFVQISGCEVHFDVQYSVCEAPYSPLCNIRGMSSKVTELSRFFVDDCYVISPVSYIYDTNVYVFTLSFASFFRYCYTTFLFASNVDWMIYCKSFDDW